jgi:hypothetical protein
LVGFIAQLFVERLRTGLAVDLCWGVPRHDGPGDFRESQPPPQTAKMKFFHSFILSPYKAMQEWHNRIGDMLAYVNDVLTPHGFDETVKDDFAALRQMVLRLR